MSLVPAFPWGFNLTTLAGPSKEAPIPPYLVSSPDQHWFTSKAASTLGDRPNPSYRQSQLVPVPFCHFKGPVLHASMPTAVSKASATYKCNSHGWTFQLDKQGAPPQQKDTCKAHRRNPWSTWFWWLWGIMPWSPTEHLLHKVTLSKQGVVADILNT